MGWREISMKSWWLIAGSNELHCLQWRQLFYVVGYEGHHFPLGPSPGAATRRPIHGRGCLAPDENVPTAGKELTKLLSGFCRGSETRHNYHVYFMARGRAGGRAGCRSDRIELLLF